MPYLDSEKQRHFAEQVVERLRAAGFEALWAGGCVRDRLLGRTPKDYDVATNARPEEIRAVFGHRRTRAIGAAFGVISVIGPKSAGHVEVATFREDSTYSDGRRPDAVHFSTAQADAQRRDFTINGLFYDPVAQHVIDYVGGQDDLRHKIIRAIGDPAARIAEDKLRMLRAVRFAATFEFSLESATAAAIRAMSHQVTVVSIERIAAELRLMLALRTRAEALEQLRELGLLRDVLPEVHAEDTRDWAIALGVLKDLGEDSFPLGMAAMLHRFVDGRQAHDISRRLRLSNDEVDRITWLVREQASLRNSRELYWPRLQRLLIHPGIGELLVLHESIARATGEALDDYAFCRELLGRPQHELNPRPLINGDDLIAHGAPRGKIFQTLLDQVRDAQLLNQISTRADALKLVDRLLSAR